MALAWGFAEIFTAISATLGWPDWTRTAVVVLFILGFPAVLLLAWLFDADADGIRRADPDSRTGRLFIGSAIVAVVAVTIVTVPYIQPASVDEAESIPTEITRVQWAEQVAAPEIERLLGTRQMVQAYDLAKEALAVAPNDERLQELASEATRPIEVLSTPLGATVSVKAYDSREDEWHVLGVTPFNGVPESELRWRVEKEGFVAVEVGRHPFREKFHVSLQREGDHPARMVEVSGGPSIIYDESVQPGPTTKVQDFWLDQFETTNAEYRVFLRSEAFRSVELWQPLLNEISFNGSVDDALSLLVDTLANRGQRPGL